MIEPISALDQIPRELAPVSQMGQGVLNACGIACALMLLKDCGLAANETVARWSGIIDSQQDGTRPSEVGQMMAKLGGSVVYGLGCRYPRLQLTQYSRLPRELQYAPFQGRDFLHWIVRVDDAYFDPLYPQGQGGPLATTREILNSAEVGAENRVALTNSRIVMVSPEITPRHDNKPFVVRITAESWRVRSAPAINALTIGVLRQGQTIDAVGAYGDGALRWAAVPLHSGDAVLFAFDESTREVNGIALGWVKFGEGWRVDTADLIEMK